MLEKIRERIRRDKVNNKRGSTLLVVVGTILALTILTTMAFSVSANTKIQVDNVLSDSNVSKARSKLSDAANLFAEKMKQDNTSVKSHAALIYYAYDVYTLQKLESDGCYYRLYIIHNDEYIYMDIFFASSGDSGDSSMNDTLFSKDAKISEIYSVDNMSSMYLASTGYMPARDYPVKQISTIPSKVDTINEVVNYADRTATLLVDSLSYVYCENDQANRFLQEDGTYSNNLSTAAVAYTTGYLGGNAYYTTNDTLNTNKIYCQQYNNDDAKRVAIYLELLDMTIQYPSMSKLDLFGLMYEGNGLDASLFGSVANAGFKYSYKSSEQDPSTATVIKTDVHSLNYDYAYMIDGTPYTGNNSTTLDSTKFATYLCEYLKLKAQYENYVSVKDFMRMVIDDIQDPYGYDVYSAANRSAARSYLLSNIQNAIMALNPIPDELINNLSFLGGLTVRDVKINKINSIETSSLTYNYNKQCWYINANITFKYQRWLFWWRDTSATQDCSVPLSAEALYDVISSKYQRPLLNPAQYEAELASISNPNNTVYNITACKYLYILADYLDRFVDENYVVNGRTIAQIVENQSSGAKITGYAGRFANPVNANKGTLKLDSVQIYVYYEKANGEKDKVKVDLKTIYIAAISTNPQISSDGNPVIANEGSIAPITAINYFERNYSDQFDNANENIGYSTNTASTNNDIYSTYDYLSIPSLNNSILENVTTNTYYKNKFTYNNLTTYGYYSTSETINIKDKASVYIDGDLILKDNASLIMEPGTTLFINGDLIIDYFMVSGDVVKMKAYGVDVSCKGANIIVDGNIEYTGIKAKDTISIAGYSQLDCTIPCGGNENAHNGNDEYRSNFEGIFIVNGDVNFYSKSFEYSTRYSNPLLASTFYIDGKIDLRKLWTPCLYDLCRPNFIFAKVIVQPDLVIKDMWSYMSATLQNYFGAGYDVNEYCQKMGYLFIICEDAINFSAFNFASVNVFTPYNVTTEGIQENQEVQSNITKYIDKSNIGLYTEEDIDSWGLPPILRQAMFDSFIGGNMSETKEDPMDNTGYILVYDPTKEEEVE